MPRSSPAGVAKDAPTASRTLAELPGGTAGSRRLAIAIIQAGSRGDLQPVCLLGRALQAAGHTVWVVAESRNESFVTSQGLGYRRMAGDCNCWQTDAKAVEDMLMGDAVAAFRLATTWRYRAAPIAAVLESVTVGAAGADLVVSGGLTVAEAVSVAESMGAAFAFLNLTPWVAFTADYGLPVAPLGLGLLCRCSRALNWLSWDAAIRMSWRDVAEAVNAWRVASLGLPSCAHPRGPYWSLVEAAVATAGGRDAVLRLNMGSSLLCIDGRPASDWGAAQPLVGPILAPLPEEPPPADLAAFLEGGGAPVVYIGFGSMGHPRPAALAALLVEACTAASVRGVVVSGWSDLDSGPVRAVLQPAVDAGTLLVLPAVSHTWLFPRVAAIVHHAGIGTTHAALASGVPQVR